MRIRDWETTQQAGTLEIGAEIDGFRLWYRVPDRYQVARSADPFLAAALLPAMVRGEELTVDPPLVASPALLKNLSRLQEIFHTWNPALATVQVTADTAPAEQLNGGALSFYSGGVDSSYTFLKHEGEISHLVFIHGFDFYDKHESFRVAVERNSRFADGFGKALIPVETNHYPFGYRYAMSRNLSQGSVLGSVALLLGFPTAYIPSAYTYNQLAPLGSHPLIDPLWSNETVEVIHDGCEARRTDKLRRIVASDTALANLRVCFEDMNVNCGHCAKCLRTMIPLAFMGAEGAPFPPLPTAKVLVDASVADEFERSFLAENVELATATATPELRELREALRKGLRRAEARSALRHLDAALLGGWIRRLTVRTQPIVSIDSTPPDA